MLRYSPKWGNYTPFWAFYTPLWEKSVDLRLKNRVNPPLNILKIHRLHIPHNKIQYFQYLAYIPILFKKANGQRV